MCLAPVVLDLWFDFPHAFLLDKARACGATFASARLTRLSRHARVRVTGFTASVDVLSMAAVRRLLFSILCWCTTICKLPTCAREACNCSCSSRARPSADCARSSAFTARDCAARSCASRSVTVTGGKGERERERERVISSQSTPSSTGCITSQSSSIFLAWIKALFGGIVLWEERR